MFSSRYFATCLILAITSPVLLAKPPKSQQSQIKGLLIIQLPNGGYAGAASQMNATAIPIKGTPGVKGPLGFEIGFNQSVGPMMAGATREVEKLMRVRHPKNIPVGHRIEFGFADKHTLKDGPSAAVACALLAESIIAGIAMDQSFAVTGDITATGEVRPIGGVAAKLRGAANRKCRIMAVPKKNVASIEDIYVLEGIEPIIASQIISIETFDQALEIARESKSVEIQKAIDEFTAVQTVIQRSPANASHPKVLEKLKAILTTIPNHESARIIALHGMKRGPSKLSLPGSLEAIDTAANQLSATMRNGSFVNRGTDDPLWKSASTLNRLRANVDPRTKNYLDAFLGTANFVQRNRDKTIWSTELKTDFQAAIQKIDIEANKLRNDHKIQEELMGQ